MRSLLGLLLTFSLWALKALVLVSGWTLFIEPLGAPNLLYYQAFGILVLWQAFKYLATEKDLDYLLMDESDEKGRLAVRMQIRLVISIIEVALLSAIMHVGHWLMT